MINAPRGRNLRFNRYESQDPKKFLNPEVHGVFLDLPAPWAAVAHVTNCLVPGGKVVTFSPCVEQVGDEKIHGRRMGKQWDLMGRPWNLFGFSGKTLGEEWETLW